MTAADTLHHKTLLAEDLRANPAMQYLLNQIGPQISRDKGAPVPAQQVREELAASLSLSANYYVSAEMVTLTCVAAETLPEDAVVHQHEVPSPFGFVWLAAPFRTIDLDGNLHSTHAAVWHPLMDGTAYRIWWLGDSADPVDTKSRLWRDSAPTLPRLYPFGYTTIEVGKPLPTQMVFGGPQILDPTTTVKVDEVNGRPRVVIDRVSPREQMTLTETVSPDTRFITVLWRLMQQQVTTVTPQRASRASRRRAERKGLRDHDVRVVTLRRASRGNQESGTRTVEWSHRWIVSGHWRNQWYGSGDDRHQRMVYINPFLKGPSDAPLLNPSTKVSALVR